MSHSRTSRREFLHALACAACSGGAAALLPQLRMMGTALAGTPLSGYKAIVCIYLAGGNDSWNLIVPHDQPRFDVYSAARNGVFSGSNPGGLGLANPADGDPQIVTDNADSNPATNQYFLHPSLVSMADLYRANQVALVLNTGTLVRPIDMSDYSNPANRPPQLYSHADQENLWHQANTATKSVLGWGGLCADNLQAQGANGTPIGTGPQLSLCVSIAGANRFEIGNVVTNPYQLSSGGLKTLSGVCNPTCSGNSQVRDTALNALLADTYANDFAQEYSNIFGRGRDLFAMLDPNLGTGPYALTTTFPDTTLGNQLEVVAEMIKLSQALNYASRQIYYVRLGGFDLHSGLMSTNQNSTTDHAGLLTQVDQAVAAFWTEMTSQGRQNDVVAFTASEFARTLQSNGSGSDHAWGAVQWVLGGAVAGGRLYSDGNNGVGISGFPNQAYGDAANPNPNAFSRGQLIPGIGVEQYAATIAQWSGVGSGSLNAIFPNLPDFGGTLSFL